MLSKSSMNFDCGRSQVTQPNLTVPAVNEVVLATLPGEHERERLQVVLFSGARHGLALRQQTFGEGVGWFNQRSVDLHPDQISQLRTVLGGPVTSRQALITPPTLDEGQTEDDHFPRILRLESA